MNIKMEKMFKIDFFELSFLAEACIPPRPIARMSFWHDLINKHYYELNDEQRANLFEWIQRNSNFDPTNEDCDWFLKRYDPDNQYMVETDFEGNKNSHHTFLINDRYYVSMILSINEDYITSVTKIKLEE
jgi:hypothetical protein